MENNNIINILDNVSKLYCKYGIRSVTMDDVAKEMSISKKTLYLHFRNKEDLVERTLRWRMNNPLFSFEVETFETDNAIDRYLKFHNFITEHVKNANISLEYDLCKYYPKLYEELKEFRLKQFMRGIQENLEQGIKEELFRTDLNIQFISKMLVTFYFNFWKEEYHNSKNEQELINPEHHRELTLYHLHGICSEKGIKYLKIKTPKINKE